MSFTFDLYQTLALSVAAVTLGSFIRKKISFFERFCIPEPVIGGLVFSVLSCILYKTGLMELSFDETMRDVCMVFFFTAVGFQADLKTLKGGGKALGLFSAAIAILIVSQNTISIVMSKVLGISPLVGMCTGSISLCGGHGTSGAFGPVLEAAGLEGATTFCIAAATYGLIAGGLIGGPVGNSLIRRKNLLKAASGTNEAQTDAKEKGAAEQNTARKSTAGENTAAKSVERQNAEHQNTAGENTAVQNAKRQNNAGQNFEGQNTAEKNTAGTDKYAAAVFQLIAAVGIGTVVSWAISKMGMTFPVYVGAMIVATIMRNLSEYTGRFKVCSKEIDRMSGIFLNLFLGIAMVTLKIWQLAQLALPLIILLAVQTVFMILYAVFVVFNMLGRDYDAAVMTSGICGLGLGASPTAMANMQSVCRIYAPSIKAFLIVPIVGGVILDLINSISITFFINMIR